MSGTTAGGATSEIGLSTYAYLWRMSDRVPAPMTLDDVLRDAAAQGVRLFQVCDHAPLDTAPDERLREVRALADGLGITLEVGTRGTREEHLERYLHVARELGATLVRSMWTSGDDRPDAAETRRRLRAALPAYEAAGVTLALETYEQVSSAELVDLVAEIGSPALGVCLDPANTVANLEHPDDVVARCAPWTRSWHVKDFDFTRTGGWVGFHYTGVPTGTGRLDYAGIRQVLRPAERGINQVIEFWLPWQDAAAGETDAETTVRTEQEWTTLTLEYLRSRS
ncbi:sugar phosphate isomerase/epimerase family protein [Puerhibacterium sp. TATVAM-FAB25]|uniref:sugar phosphate isomerase/epimerase family protein n=1 Tax=Puerhibacterium sp. TATVAM-FAB25 TaxID=3093699 RepID=UPI003979B45D